MVQAADIPLDEQYELMRQFQGTTRYEPEGSADKVPDVSDPEADE